FRSLQRPSLLVEATWQDRSRVGFPSIVVTVTGRGAPTSIISVSVRRRRRSEASLDLSEGHVLPAMLQPGQTLTFQRRPTGGLLVAWSKGPLVAVVRHSLSRRPVVARVAGRGHPSFLRHPLAWAAAVIKGWRYGSWVKARPGVRR